MPTLPTPIYLFGYDLCLALEAATANGFAFEDISTLLAIPTQIHGVTKIVPEHPHPSISDLLARPSPIKRPRFCVHTANSFESLCLDRHSKLNNLFEVSYEGARSPAFSSAPLETQLTPTLCLPLKASPYAWDTTLTSAQVANLLEHNIPQFPSSELTASFTVKQALRWSIDVSAGHQQKIRLQLRLATSLHTPSFSTAFHSDDLPFDNNDQPLDFQTGTTGVCRALLFLQLLQDLQQYNPQLRVATPNPRSQPTDLLVLNNPTGPELFQHWPDIGFYPPYPSPAPLPTDLLYPFEEWVANLDTISSPPHTYPEHLVHLNKIYQQLHDTAAYEQLSC